MSRVMCILGMLFLIGATSTAADEFETLFQQGNSYYDQGEYHKAVEAYEQILAAGRGNWQVYYNLGNAYFRLNRMGKAILNYERALKLDSDNEDILFNLQLANLRIVDRIPEPPKQAFVRWVEGMFWKPSFMGLLWTTLTMYALALLAVSLRAVLPRLGDKGAFRLASRTLWIAFVMALMIFSLRWYKEATRTYAIVMVQEVEVTSSPSRDAVELFSLHEGTKLQIQELSNSWARIRLRDGKVGWIPAEAIEII